MSNFVTHDALSITCTCTHGGGGHVPACAMFTATAEQYREVCAERDNLHAAIVAGAVLAAAGRSSKLSDFMLRFRGEDEARKPQTVEQQMAVFKLYTAACAKAGLK